MMMFRRLILFCLILSALACEQGKKEVLEEVLPTQLSALEEEILLAGIDSLMTYVSTYKADVIHQDFLITDTFFPFLVIFGCCLGYRNDLLVVEFGVWEGLFP